MSHSLMEIAPVQEERLPISNLQPFPVVSKGKFHHRNLLRIKLLLLNHSRALIFALLRMFHWSHFIFTHVHPIATDDRLLLLQDAVFHNYFELAINRIRERPIHIKVTTVSAISGIVNIAADP